MIRPKVKCAACEKRIPESEPDVMLRRLDAPGHTPGERVRYYHTRCTESALELAASAPEAWLMTVRHVQEALN